MIVKVPFTDFNSYPSPALSALSDTSSIFEFPSVELEFFNTNAPSVTFVVKRKLSNDYVKNFKANFNDLFYDHCCKEIGC